jgi:membrane-bound lytic murein transglycosylase B
MLAAAVLLSLAPLSGAAFAAEPPATESFALRSDVQAFIADMVDRHGFSEEALTGLFMQVRPQAQVIRTMTPPAEAPQRSWQAYRSLFLNPRRIDAGVRFREANAAALQRAVDEYGVPAEIVVAIIGVETVYGRNTGKFRVLDALATLAFDYPPRASYFRGELEQFLLHAREADVDPLSLRGSYAGAIGIPQFMPGSYRRFAVDFDGDGRRDLIGSPADAIGSVAHFLSEHGWQRGEPIASPAAVTGDTFRTMLLAGIKPDYRVSELPAFGVTPAEPLPEALWCALIDLETPGEPTEYWVGLQNFYVITRYNRSSFYATAVVELARAIREASASDPASSVPPAGAAK